MKDLGYPSLFTGVAIEKHAKGLFLSQKIFAEKTLAMFNMSDCKPLHSPTTGTRLTKEGAPALDPKVPYRSAVGVLLWLARNTRPDLSFAVSQVARFCHAPTTAHWSAVKRIFRYLKGTIDLGIPIYKQATKLFILKALTDADWAGDAENRYTTGGYIIMIGGIPIFWVSTVYKAVCKSSVGRLPLQVQHRTCLGHPCLPDLLPWHEVACDRLLRQPRGASCFEEQRCHYQTQAHSNSELVCSRMCVSWFGHCGVLGD